MKALLSTAAAAMILAGCAEEIGGNDFFDREAGARVDSNADFGNATMNNMLAQTGQADLAISLGRRFASEVTSTVNFAFDSAHLSNEAKAVLRQQATWIRQFPEIRFKVFGHTDLVGSQAYNRNLGLRRANAVVHYLTQQGISRSRLEAVVSFGETRPIIQTTDRSRQNRRTVTEVSGFVEGHAGVINGKYAQVIFREYVASAVPRTSVAQSEVASGGE
ncbi:OmpA family protein [Yoonia sp. 208BN28-4]|uniref:OmpA family protein n=1 Tax=Yoonia sp. 208BN28-4 TaxID=3126505 RepID=UPI00404034E4